MSHPCLYSKKFLAHLVVNATPDELKRLLDDDPTMKFMRYAIWELATWFYTSTLAPNREKFLGGEDVLTPFMTIGMIELDDEKRQWLQTSCHYFYTAFTTLARAVLDWYAANRPEDRKIVVEMHCSALPEHLVVDFQSAVIYRAEWLYVAGRYDARETCIWEEYVNENIPEMYDQKQRGDPDHWHILALYTDIVLFLLGIEITDEVAKDIWEIWRAPAVRSLSG